MRGRGTQSCPQPSRPPQQDKPATAQQRLQDILQFTLSLGLAICAVPAEAAVAGCAEQISGLPALRGPSLVKRADERRPERPGWSYALLEQLAPRAWLATLRGLCPQAQPWRCLQQPLAGPWAGVQGSACHFSPSSAPPDQGTSPSSRDSAGALHPAPGAAVLLILQLPQGAGAHTRELLQGSEEALAWPGWDRPGPMSRPGPGSRTAAAPNHTTLGVVSRRAGASQAMEGNLRDGKGLQLSCSS